MTRYEDLVVGHAEEIGEHHFSEAEIRDFREQFDPLPDGAPLTVSLWHLTATWMGFNIRRAQALSESYMFSPGVRDIQPGAPVVPGDRIAFRTTILSKRESRSRQGLGLVENLSEGMHADGRLAVRFVGAGFMPID